MARRRDYKAEYARRQAKARAAGFQNYYARRVRAGRPPSAPAPTGEELRRARGHASRADLIALFESGRAAVVSQTPVGDRDPKTGRYPAVRVTVMTTDGEQRTFMLRGKQLAGDQVRGLQQAAAAAGADVYTNPSLDVLGITLPDVDLDLEHGRAIGELA